MPVKFNPFTGQLQIDEKGSGGGSSYIDGEVQNFSALPQTVGSPAVDSAYLVREAEGAWLLNRKPAGIYIRTANTGARASDWTYAGEFPDVFNDANLVVYNNADSTKNAKFDVSAIAAATTRTITVPNKNVTLDDAGDSRTPTAHAASHAAAGSDPLFDQDLNTTDAVEFSTVVVTATLDASAASNTFLAPINTSIALVDTASAFTGTLRTDNDSLTANRTYDLPDASGTLALTSDIPANTIASTIVDAKGDLIVGTAADTVARLPVGATNGHVLTVDSAEASGMKWAAASGGGVTGAASSASDVLGVSGSNITGVDAGSADRLVFWDDSANKLTYLEAGSGLSISGTTLTATASGGSKTCAVFTAEHNQPPSTAFATLDTRNSIAVLDFDAATDESAVFVGIMPEAASLGSGLIVRLHWMATSATSGNVRWGVQFERSNTDLDADSFAAAVEANGAANGTSGILTTTAITVTDFDGITAGDVFRLKVFRNADDATNDTMTGDAELVAVEVRSAA